MRLLLLSDVGQSSFAAMVGKIFAEIGPQREVPVSPAAASSASSTAGSGLSKSGASSVCRETIRTAIAVGEFLDNVSSRPVGQVAGDLVEALLVQPGKEEARQAHHRSSAGREGYVFGAISRSLIKNIRSSRRLRSNDSDSNPSSNNTASEQQQPTRVSTTLQMRVPSSVPPSADGDGGDGGMSRDAGNKQGPADRPAVRDRWVVIHKQGDFSKQESVILAEETKERLVNATTAAPTSPVSISTAAAASLPNAATSSPSLPIKSQIMKQSGSQIMSLPISLIPPPADAESDSGLGDDETTMATHQAPATNQRLQPEDDPLPRFPLDNPLFPIAGGDSSARLPLPASPGCQLSSWQGASSHLPTCQLHYCAPIPPTLL